jgi:hypothetical protein
MLQYHRIFSNIAAYPAILAYIRQYAAISPHILLDVHTTEICGNIAAYCSKRMCSTFFEKYTAISQHIFYRMSIGTKRTSSHCRNIGQYRRISRDIAVYTAILPYVRRYCRIYGDIAGYMAILRHMRRYFIAPRSHTRQYNMRRYRGISPHILCLV